MLQCNIYEAKTRLSQLVQAALDGEEVVIARAGKPAVRLVPVAQAGSRTGGWGVLRVDPDTLDKAFQEDIEAEVDALFLADGEH